MLTIQFNKSFIILKKKIFIKCFNQLIENKQIDC